MLFFANRKEFSPRLIALLLGVALLAAGASGASAQWAGENGVIRFSFTAGDSIVPVAHLEPQNGVTMVELHTWLTDVVPTARNGEAFMAIGGFELKLVVEGAEAHILGKTVPGNHLDVGPAVNTCIVGLDPGLAIRNGKALLVTWNIMFQGDPKDVVFRLDTEPSHSGKQIDGCKDAGSPGLYIGVETSGMLGTFFGAAGAPAYLNPTKEPDLNAVHGRDSFEEIGLFTRR
jgi:hypothetical protein